MVAVGGVPNTGHRGAGGPDQTDPKGQKVTSDAWPEMARQETEHVQPDGAVRLHIQRQQVSRGAVDCRDPVRLKTSNRQTSPCFRPDGAEPIGGCCRGGER